MESFALRAFLIVIGFQLLMLLILIFGSDNGANIHGQINESHRDRFEYD